MLTSLLYRLAPPGFRAHSLAQDYAVAGIKFRTLEKRKAARSILHILNRARYASLAKGLRGWLLCVADDAHLKKVR